MRLAFAHGTCLASLIGLALVCSPQTSPAQSKAPGDLVRLKTGKEFRGQVTGIKEGKLILAIKAEYGNITRSVPIETITTVSFDETDALLKKLPSIQNVANLEELWTAREPFLTLPDSAAGAVGLRLARVLLKSGAPGATRADDVLQRVEADDWNKSRRIEATGMRFEATVKAGDESTALANAKEALTKKDKPRIRTDASYFLAGQAIESYRKLVEENPRWEQDPFIRPEIDRLYYEAIDLLLIPYLDYGYPTDPAARSLQRLAEFFDSTGQTEAAAAVAQDIVTIYPETSYAKTAAKRLTDSAPKPNQP